MKNVFLNPDVLAAEKEIYSALNIPPITLMENAGVNSAEFILTNFSDEINSEVIILTGKGNNAGDGFVIARRLMIEKINVKVILLYNENELKGDALTNYNILKNVNNDIKLIFCKDDKAVKKEISDENKIIIDAIFGVGFKGVPEPNIKKIIEFLNELKNKTIISIDCPSCLYKFDQKSICVNANSTLTMGVKKFDTMFYKGKESSGAIEIVNIGVPEEDYTKHNTKKIFEIEAEDVRQILPIRKINSNKYTNGKVLILAGSRGLTGAAYLCSMAALRTGAGAVVVGIPDSICDIMEIKLTEVMKLRLDETSDETLSLKSYDKIKERLLWADSVLIGPGISKNEETLELVRKIVKENDLNFVVDADAIAAFKGNLNLLRNKKIILTPHSGEFANLIGKVTGEIISDFYKHSRAFTNEYNVSLILKNSPTIISYDDRFYINSTGKENLATVGTGDVLSGIVTALFSQIKKPLESLIAGVYIHGRCGDNLYSKFGPSSMIAGDLIDEIANVKIELMEK